jgi:3-oxoacyl-[acyl-carrier-protein] synthase-1
MVLALPEARRAGTDPRLRTELVERIAAMSSIAIDGARSELLFEGRAAGAKAFEHALARIAAGEDEAVVVGGVDSYFDPDLLEHLDRELRLHGDATENGFIPGEGAAFLLLSRSAPYGLPSLAHVEAAATAPEPHPYGAEIPCRGDGITKAMRDATASVSSAAPVGWLLTDVVNERHRIDELTYAHARNHDRFVHTAEHEQPLLKAGDLGAASAPMLVTIAAVRWTTGCAPHPRALVATHSEGALRGAVLVSGHG